MALGLLKPIKSVPENGIVIFCGRVRTAEGNNEEEISKILSPPLPIKANMYKCDKLFHTEYVYKLFRTHKTYGYIVLVSDSFYLAIIEGTKRKVVYKYSTDFSTNTRRGGQSSNRFARLREEQKHAYKIKVMETVILHLKNTDGVIIAGNAELPREISEELTTSKQFRVPVLGILKISKPNLEDIIEKSLEIISDEDILREKKSIENIRELLRKDPDLLVFGRKSVLEYDQKYMLKYALVNEEFSLSNTQIEKITYSSFLSDYDGAIGVLYYKFDQE